MHAFRWQTTRLSLLVPFSPSSSLFQPPYDLPSLPLPSCSTGHDHPWMVLFHSFVPQTYPPTPSICACKRKRKKKKEKKSGWPLMDTTRRVNIARVNRLIGQPMAEASLSSSPCIVAHFSRRLASLLASSPVRHRVCPRKGGLSEERALHGSSFVIISNRDIAFLHFLHFLL